MCLTISWFETFNALEGCLVILSNNKSVLGIGSIKLKMFDGMEKILSNVRCILGLKRNLISLGDLDKSGYTCKSELGTLKITKR